MLLHQYAHFFGPAERLELTRALKPVFERQACLEPLREWDRLVLADLWNVTHVSAGVAELLRDHGYTEIKGLDDLLGIPRAVGALL